jgi:histidinol-phosphatase (PHP family)
VHTEWSYDAKKGSMEKSCERALELGLPAIAFTDHADFVKVHSDQHCVDIAGYLDAVERCRSRFTGLRILSGVELGEPHWFPDETAAVLAAGPLDNVLGSVHCVKVDGQLVDASEFGSREGLDVAAATRDYYHELLAMLEGGQPFEVLAHLDYPKRYWRAYREKDYEEEIRDVLKAAVRTGRVLEVNTTRGDTLCPDLSVVRWWRELGGQAVQYGSDAHSPDKVAEGFRVATQMVESAGFKPARDPVSVWRR